MGCGKRTCRHTSCGKNPKTSKSPQCDNGKNRERDLKIRSVAQSNIPVHNHHSAKRYAPSVSKVDNENREKTCKARESRSRNTPNEIAYQASSAACRRYHGDGKVKYHKKNCPKYGVSIAKTDLARKPSLSDGKGMDKKNCPKYGVSIAKTDLARKPSLSDGKGMDKKTPCTKYATKAAKNTMEQGSSNKKNDRKESALKGMATRKTGSSKNWQVLREPCQYRKFFTFFAADKVDLARRERRRKASTNESRLIRSEDFIYVKHPKAPEGVSPADRLDALDTYLLRIRFRGKNAPVQKHDVSRWIINDTQETLCTLAMVHINKIRAKRRLSKVILDKHLIKASGKHNYDQAYLIRDGRTHHTDSHGKDLKGRLKSMGYKAKLSADLLARGPESVLEVLEYFMDRSHYTKVMLHPSIRSMGIHGGKDLFGNWFWTLILCG